MARGYPLGTTKSQYFALSHHCPSDWSRVKVRKHLVNARHSERPRREFVALLESEGYAGGAPLSHRRLVARRDARRDCRSPRGALRHQARPCAQHVARGRGPGSSPMAPLRSARRHGDSLLLRQLHDRRCDRPCKSCKITPHLHLPPPMQTASSAKLRAAMFRHRCSIKDLYLILATC